LFDGVNAIHRLATDLPFSGWFQKGTQTPPEYLVIVNNEQPGVLHFDVQERPL
jgi:hypothetical protein